MKNIQFSDEINTTTEGIFSGFRIKKSESMDSILDINDNQFRNYLIINKL